MVNRFSVSRDATCCRLPAIRTFFLSALVLVITSSGQTNVSSSTNRIVESRSGLLDIWNRTLTVVSEPKFTLADENVACSPLQMAQIWGVAVLFSDAKPSLTPAYRIMRASTKRQHLRLLLVHVIVPGSPEGELDADIYVPQQGRAAFPVSREYYLNVALHRLPDSCTKIVWLDPDVIFTNPSWVCQTAIALNTYSAVQPFAFQWTLPPGVVNIDAHTALFTNSVEIPEDVASQSNVTSSNPLKVPTVASLPSGLQYSEALRRFAFGSVSVDQCPLGETGGAWAAKLSTIRRLRFFDGFVFGGGHVITALAFCGDFQPAFSLLGQDGRPILEAWNRLLRWMKKAKEAIKCRIGLVPGLIGRIWAGPKDPRSYSELYSGMIETHRAYRLEMQHEVGRPVWDARGTLALKMVTPVYLQMAQTAASRPKPDLSIESFLYAWGHATNRHQRPQPSLNVLWSTYQEVSTPASAPPEIMTDEPCCFLGNVPPHKATRFPHVVIDSVSSGVFVDFLTFFHSVRANVNSHKVNNFCAITAFFNPSRYPNKIIHFRRFRRSTAAQGLWLLTVQLAFDNAPFEVLPNDTDHLISLRTSSVNAFFVKESLLNIALRDLPTVCEYMAWLDGDILFSNDDWISQTITALQTYTIVQPYSIGVRLMCGQQPLDVKTMLLWNVAPEEPLSVRYSAGYSKTARYSRHGKTDRGWCYSYFVMGHPGFAWATRVSAMRQVGGFFDFVVGAGADSLQLFALMAGECPLQAFKPTLEHLSDAVYHMWMSRIGKWMDVFKGKLGYVDNVIFHLWHGQADKRQNLGTNTAPIYAVLKKENFNPNLHFVLTPQGLPAWSPLALEKKELIEIVGRYLEGRDEFPASCPPWAPPVCKTSTACLYRYWMWTEYRFRALLRQYQQMSSEPSELLLDSLASSSTPSDLASLPPLPSDLETLLVQGLLPVNHPVMIHTLGGAPTPSPSMPPVASASPALSPQQRLLLVPPPPQAPPPNIHCLTLEMAAGVLPATAPVGVSLQSCTPSSRAARFRDDEAWTLEHGELRSDLFHHSTLLLPHCGVVREDRLAFIPCVLPEVQRQRWVLDPASSFLLVSPNPDVVGAKFFRMCLEASPEMGVYVSNVCTRQWSTTPIQQ